MNKPVNVKSPADGQSLFTAGLGRDPITWEIAAKCLGELLSDTGPNGYYAMTPSQWFLWAADEAKKLRPNVEVRGRPLLGDPSSPPG